jgi:2-polyprenyl-3-methyl-5-hydroxy-6-metoxy-1,4-benzoquinol methylase
VLTENEIRPNELMAEQARRFANDVARLMRHKDDFVWVDCPACGKDDTEPAFSKYGLSYVTCQNCETLYANPRPRPEHLEEYYTESENYAYWNQFIFPASENARREKIFKPRVERVLDVCRRYEVPMDTLLEVGAGFGLFCEEMLKLGVFQQVIGIEPTPDLAETCRKRGIPIVQKLIENVEPKDLGNASSVSVLANFEVIEHLFSPRDFLMRCAAIMPKGAILILTCPNGKGFDVTVLGALSPAIDAEHINLFNLDSLSLLLASCGFEVVERQTPGKLDAELVRNKILAGEFDVSNQPFLHQVLVENWETAASGFQQFLSDHCLSSNMMLIARKQ